MRRRQPKYSEAMAEAIAQAGDRAKRIDADLLKAREAEAHRKLADAAPALADALEEVCSVLHFLRLAANAEQAWFVAMSPDLKTSHEAGEAALRAAGRLPHG